MKWIRKREAFTLVEIMILVAIMGMLVAIMTPNYVRAKRTTQSKSCQNNLRIIKHALV